MSRLFLSEILRTETAGQDPIACQAMCRAAAGCAGWTLHNNGNHPTIPGWRCCLKPKVIRLVSAPPDTVSGLMDPDAFKPDPGPSPSPPSPAQPNSTIAFSEYYDIKSDPWQTKNLWHSLDVGRQEALKAEIAKRFACTGTRTTPSTCE
jgi:hypothetical protein